MGKFVGFIGTIRGKVGTTVFTKGVGGVTYGRAYQPQVANPKTSGQIDQRAKMNLVGRLSSITPKSLLVGMNGASNRQRRSGFNRILLGNATVDRSDTNNVVAKISPEDIVFSQGSETFAASASVPEVAARAVSVNLTLNDASLAGRYGERVIVAIVDPSDKSGFSAIKYVDQVLDGTSKVTVSVSFPVSIENESLVCVYRVPFVLNDAGVSYRSRTINNDGQDVIARILSSNVSYVRGFGNSDLLSSSVFSAA